MIAQSDASAPETLERHGGPACTVAVQGPDADARGLRGGGVVEGGGGKADASLPAPRNPCEGYHSLSPASFLAG